MRITTPPLFFALLGIASLPVAHSGPVAWGLCQTACDAGLVSCVVAAAGTMGPAAVGEYLRNDSGRGTAVSGQSCVGGMHTRTMVRMLKLIDSCRAELLGHPRCMHGGVHTSASCSDALITEVTLYGGVS